MPVVSKSIKFDLPIDGIKANNLEQLRDHFTIEILAHYRSGLLTKWLTVRKLEAEVAAMQALTGFDELALLKGLCAAFAIEIDDEVAAIMLQPPPEKTALTVAESHTVASKQIANDLGRYSDLGDGTVLDKETGLQWMRYALGQTWDGQTCTGEANEFDWDQAKSAAAASRDAGYHDWHLPTIDELKTLIVVENKPTIDHHAFPNTPAAWFWSSSPDAYGSDYAWYVSFYFGYAYYNYRNFSNHVRLVRGGF